jgi:hypothetical protein
VPCFPGWSGSRATRRDGADFGQKDMPLPRRLGLITGTRRLVPIRHVAEEHRQRAAITCIATVPRDLVGKGNTASLRPAPGRSDSSSKVTGTRCVIARGQRFAEGSHLVGNSSHSTLPARSSWESQRDARPPGSGRRSGTADRKRLRRRLLASSSAASTGNVSTGDSRGGLIRVMVWSQSFSSGQSEQSLRLCRNPATDGPRQVCDSIHAISSLVMRERRSRLLVGVGANSRARVSKRS